MTNSDLLRSERWQQVRDYVYFRDHGRCVICGAPGQDAHHWFYNWGFFNPDFISLVCRPCHEVWQGRNPDHLADSHPLKPKLMRIAEISRYLGKGDRFQTSVVDLFDD